MLSHGRYFAGISASVGSSDPTAKPSTTVVHVVRAVDQGTHVQTRLRVFILVMPNWELSFSLLRERLLGFVGGLRHVLLVDDAALDQALGLLEIAHGVHDLRVGGDVGLLEIELFWSHVFVNPGCVNDVLPDP